VYIDRNGGEVERGFGGGRASKTQKTRERRREKWEAGWRRMDSRQKERAQGESAEMMERI
jgi:hypothetical protein